ncbi:MAG TPA: hypothetical protein VKT72_12510 [Candidatus Baltobacteraceae bacterium]|nr:hypothetical protein [Candidatus Baltobacteraceae bacterium]
MAIRPVDLQLAYMAAPQNAAVLSNAQDAPQAAQQAAQAAFAAEVMQRQETVDEPVKVEGSKVRAREDQEREDGGSSPDHRRRQASEEEQAYTAGPLGLAGEGEHLIDVTA